MMYDRKQPSMTYSFFYPIAKTTKTKLNMLTYTYFDVNHIFFMDGLEAR